MKKYDRIFVIQHPNYFKELEAKEYERLSIAIKSRLDEERKKSLVVHSYSIDSNMNAEMELNELKILEDYVLIRFDSKGEAVPKYKLSEEHNMNYFMIHPEFKRIKQNENFLNVITNSSPKMLKPTISENEIVLVEDWLYDNFKASARYIASLSKKNGTVHISGLYSNDGYGCVDMLSKNISILGVDSIVNKNLTA